MTNDDKVFGFGLNICNQFVYNERNDKKYVLIQQLCDKSIEQIFGDCDAFFARSETNEIYSWGCNELAQLWRGFGRDQYMKPDKNEFLSDKNIIQISGSFSQHLALSSDNKVYGVIMN